MTQSTLNTSGTYGRPEPRAAATQQGRVLVAMSGGVDSSVTAALLKQQGYDVVGVHMQLWDHGDANLERMGGRCCSIVDSNDARRVCDRLDIPYYAINAQEVFRAQVVDYFVHEYLQSRTPNPCVECNNKIKFNYLFEKADELDCQWVATGHYSRVMHEPVSGQARLLKAVDPQKDQTYFLFGLTQRALSRTLMPLGGFQKLMVRKLAEEYQLVNAQKPDSQEICFIGSEGYQAFIEERVAAGLRPGGVIRTLEGQIVGEHAGLHRYTIGQRKGLNLTMPRADEMFVVGFDTTNQALVVGPESALFERRLVASQVNWIRPVPSDARGTPGAMGRLRCFAKIRSRHAEAAAHVTLYDEGRVLVEFDEPQRAITPGQAIVFYDQDEVLGGGFIDRAGAPA